MAEEIIKVIENVDELFSEIIVNGESHVSERYVEPPQADIPASTPQTQEEEPTYPQQTVQGEYVDKLNLNGVEHDLKDSPLSAEVRALQELLSTIQSRLNELNALIPSTATAQNQLADKNFVNSSIATNTANFLGTYTSLADIEAIQNPTNNDYAFLETADGAGNNVYDRYKYSAEDGEWLFEYELNNSSFTAEQWATINSGITQVSDTVQDGDTNPVSSDAVYEALQNVTATPVNVVEANNMSAVTSNAVANYVGALYNVSGSIHPTVENQYFEICRLSIPKGKYVLIGISGTSLSINGTYNFRIIVNNGVIDRTVRGNSDGGGGIINSVVINIDSPITIIVYGYGHSRYVNNTSVEQYASIQAIKIGE